MKWIAVFFAVLGLTVAIQHVELVRKQHLQNKGLSVQQKRSNLGLAYVNMSGSIETTGEYYATVYLGSDRQQFTVQMDTGSTVLAIPAVGCVEYTQSGSNINPTSTKCPHANSYYDSSQSTDATTVPYNANCNQWDGSNTYCEFTLTYGDGSFLVGTLISDRVELGGVSTTAKFGQVQGESSGFASPGIDGIMGLAYQALDPYDGDDIFGKLVSAGQVNNSFSMCLGDEGGVLVLGGVDPYYNAGTMQYTPIIDETYYVVALTDFQVGTNSIGASTSDYGTVIVDSGTTLFYLADNAFNDMVNTFVNDVCPTLSSSLQQLCTGTDNIFTSGNCFELTDSDVSSFPDIHIFLEGLGSLALPPQNYFFPFVNGGTTYQCFAILSGGTDTIMGDIFMQSYNIHFDRQNVQVGFAPVQNCVGGGAGSTAGFGSSSSSGVVTVINQLLLLVCIVVAFL